MNISCPECDARITIDESIVGKKIRCKECEHIFVVKAPKSAAPKAKAPPPPPNKSKGPPAPPKAKKDSKIEGLVDEDDGTIPLAPIKDDDDDDDKNPYSLIQTNDTAPRCPFCALEMDPPEAIICLNCGYNTRTRTRKQTEAVMETTGGDIFAHRLPAFICIFVILILVAWDILFYIKIPKMLRGSIFEEGEGTNIYVAGCSPGFFRLYMTLFVVGASIPMIKFAYRRFNTRPDEVKIKDD